MYFFSIQELQELIQEYYEVGNIDFGSINLVFSFPCSPKRRSFEIVPSPIILASRAIEKWYHLASLFLSQTSYQQIVLMI